MDAEGPVFSSMHEYGARLGDATFWEPYVRHALRLHGLPCDSLAAGALGSFPTFLTRGHVVKLFADLFSGGDSFAAEVAVHGLLLRHPDIPAARLVAQGRLFDMGWTWPYHITTRLAGTAWNDSAPAPDVAARLARQLGQVLRLLHNATPPSEGVRGPEALATLRADCAVRLAAWDVLPPSLLSQVEAYVLPPSDERRLVHADLHGDHIFADAGQLVGIIDWGDAVIGDRYYELPALHLGTFRGDKHLLGAFLDGYGWPVGPDFARRAMSMTLLHEFNVLADLGPLPAVTSLDELAQWLWGLTVDAQAAWLGKSMP